MLAKNNIKLIIIDSVAAVFRYDNDTNDYISRSEDLRNIVLQLNNLAKSYYSAVICINQVSFLFYFYLKIYILYYFR